MEVSGFVGIVVVSAKFFEERAIGCVGVMVCANAILMREVLWSVEEYGIGIWRTSCAQCCECVLRMEYVAIIFGALFVSASYQLVGPTAAINQYSEEGRHTYKSL